VNCTKMRLVAGLCPEPAGGAIALPQSPLPLFGEKREGNGD